jgi:hypothetical protein
MNLKANGVKTPPDNATKDTASFQSLTIKYPFGQLITLALTADELKKENTPELEKIMVLIEEILENRSDKSAEIAVGDKVSFEIRKNCVIEGEVLAKTDKRVKVATEKISGVYQIASKKVDVLSSAAATSTEEE